MQDEGSTINRCNLIWWRNLCTGECTTSCVLRGSMTVERLCKVTAHHIMYILRAGIHSHGKISKAHQTYNEPVAKVFIVSAMRSYGCHRCRKSPQEGNNRTNQLFISMQSSTGKKDAPAAEKERQSWHQQIMPTRCGLQQRNAAREGQFKKENQGHEVLLYKVKSNTRESLSYERRRTT